MNNLSDEQKMKFAAVNAKFGLGPEESSYDAAAYQGKALVFSSDPNQSDVPPHMVSAATIAELKNLMGNPVEPDDSNVNYPPPFEPEQPGKETEYKALLKQAAQAYLLGKPEKVADYEATLNQRMFPMNVAYFASTQDLNIGQLITVSGPDPIVWNYGNIVFMPGGSVNVETELTIYCQTISKNP